MTYPEFEALWKPSGGAEQSNYGLFIQGLCTLIGVDRPNPKTDNPAQDTYVFERAVEFNDNSKRSTGRIDLYKRGCFVLETKQGTDTPDQQKAMDRAELGFAPEKRRKGHAVLSLTKSSGQQWPLGLVRAGRVVPPVHRVGGWFLRPIFFRPIYLP